MDGLQVVMILSLTFPSLFCLNYCHVHAKFHIQAEILWNIVEVSVKEFIKLYGNRNVLDEDTDVQ